jgi:hypothetical protein
MYREFKVDISPDQAKKVFHEKPIRLRAEQLGVGHAHYFHPENHKKLVKAFEAHKGMTLHMTHGEVLRTHQSGLSGSGFWGNLWSGIKKGFRWAKDSGILSKIADTAVPALATAIGMPEFAGVARGGLKSLTGVGMEPVDGGRLTMSDIKKHAMSGYQYAKKKGIVSDVIDQGEKYLISKATKPEHTEMIQSVRGHIRKKYGVGMRRRGTSGGSFRLA